MGEAGITRRALAGVVSWVAPVGSSIEADAEKLAQRMADRHGGLWKTHVDHETGFILIKPSPKPLGLS